jgi:DNA-binding response OmpR family regulator
MRPKILVVDDEEDVYRLMAFHFAKAGFDACWARDGEEGMHQVIDEHPDAVVLDVMLPRLSGIEVCKKLRDDPRTIHLSVVMLSARAEPEDRRIGVASGANRYLTKPCSPADVVNVLRELIESEALREGNAAPRL